MPRMDGSGWFAASRAIFDLPISANEKLVLFNLTRRGAVDGDAFPSIKTIAADCSLAERTVQYVLKRLHQAGFLTTETRKNANGSVSSNLYTIKIPQQMHQGATDAPGTVQQMHPHYIEERPHKKKERDTSYLERKSDSVFQRPPIETVMAYFQEKGGGKVQAEAFFDFYTSKGWKVGRETMKDWQAAARGWLRRDRERGLMPEPEEEFFCQTTVEDVMRWKERNPGYANPDAS